MVKNCPVEISSSHMQRSLRSNCQRICVPRPLNCVCRCIRAHRLKILSVLKLMLNLTRVSTTNAQWSRFSDSFKQNETFKNLNWLRWLAFALQSAEKLFAKQPQILRLHNSKKADLTKLIILRNPYKSRFSSCVTPE